MLAASLLETLCQNHYLDMLLKICMHVKASSLLL